MRAAKIDLAGVCTGPGPCDTTPFSASTTDNWVARAGGLPLYIRAIAKALVRSGHSESAAIQIAVNRVKVWAAGGDNVTAATRARAVAALAEWERKKAGAHLSTTGGSEAIDLAVSAHTYHWKHGWIPIDGDMHAPKDLGRGVTMIPGHNGGAAHITHWNVKVHGDHVGMVQITSAKRVMARRRQPEAGADMRRIAHFESPEAGARWIARSHTTRNLSATDQEAIDLAMTKGALPPLPGSDKPRFPITDHASLKKAIKAVGRATTGHAAIRRHIIARAKAIGGTHLIPDNWTSTGNLK